MFRSWYYFRTGWSIYVAFFVGFFSNIIVIYSLGIKPVIESGGPLGTILQVLFPHLTNFVVIAAVVTTPVCVYIGLLHMKRTGAYAADASVATEAHPYVYKVIPGKEQEVILPLMMLTAKGLAKMLDTQTSMTQEERKEFEDVLAKANSLLAGHPVGLPQQRALASGVKKKE